jgi:Protein of unknown function (DUF726)
MPKSVIVMRTESVCVWICVRASRHADVSSDWEGSLCVAGAWGVSFEAISDSCCTEGVECTQSSWAWALVSPQGLCGRVFQHLGMKSSSAVTLLNLPEALLGAPEAERSAALCDMVTAYAHHLDRELAFVKEAGGAAVRWQDEADGDAGATPSRSASGAGEVSLDDADLDDMLSLDPAATPPPDDPNSSGAARDDCGDGAADEPEGPEVIADGPDRAQSFPQGLTQSEVQSREEAALRAALMSLQDSPDALERITAQNRTLHEAHLTEGAVLCEPFFQHSAVYSHAANSKCFEAVQAALAGCLCPQEAPSEATGSAADAVAQPGAPCDGAAVPELTPPQLRWYDARARVACLRLAHWLRVPLATFTALEATFFHGAAAGGAPEATTPEPASRAQLHAYHSSSAQWLKVGAAAVGGGVLTALTAGLAAPAIVAGIGTVVGMTGSAGAQPS